MKLTILGTGCAWTKRGCASYLLDNNIMIDPGFGSIKQLLKSDEKLMHHEKIERIDLVFITHFHSDHYFDIPYILQKSCAGKFNENKLMIVCPPGGKKAITELCKLGLDETSVKKLDLNKYVAWCEVEEGVTYKWRDMEFYALEMDHGTSRNFGYVIKQPSGKKIGFTGDTTMCDNFIKMIEDCNTVVACMANTKKEKKLYNIVEGIDLMKQYRGKCCIIPAHMTSQGWDYAKSRITLPQDLDIFDLEAPLPYDYELQKKKRDWSVNKNFRFKSREFRTIYGVKINLQLNDIIQANEQTESLPQYKYDVINRSNGKIIGNITYHVGLNDYVNNNGNIIWRLNQNFSEHAKEACQLIQIVARAHGIKYLLIATNPDDMGNRRLCEDLGAVLSEIVIIGENDEKYFNEDEKEHCIYLWSLNGHNNKKRN